MPACNINARGKALRLVAGILAGLAGVAMLVAGWAGVYDSLWLWALAGGLVAAGAVMIYEGAAGWCVLRAMGFRTPV